MPQPPAIGKTAAQTEREQVEAGHTFRRIAELELDPVKGRFDSAHLKEINRRIFQDLPGDGFTHVKPGVFRRDVGAPDVDWMKERALSVAGAVSFVAYSRMDDSALSMLEQALAGAAPTQLQGMRTAEFTDALARLYVVLDYIHPFEDGNSRTLRTFTRQLARECGFDVNWNVFARSPAGRDLLYIARDLSVNEFALPYLKSQTTIRDVLYTRDTLGKNKGLPELLVDIVRPLRAIAFERHSASEALHEHPELAVAYNTVKIASDYFNSASGGDPEVTAQAVESIRSHIQQALDAGEISNFTR